MLFRSTLSDRKHEQSVAKTIVSNVKVIAVGRRTDSTPADDPETAIAKSITLLVTPHQAEAIDLASRGGGKARLVLRGTLDHESIVTSGVSMSQLLGQATAESRPPVVPYAAVVQHPATRPTPTVETIVKRTRRVRTVEVIRSGTMSKVNLPIEESNNTATADGNASVQEAIPGAQSP